MHLSCIQLGLLSIPCNVFEMEYAGSACEGLVDSKFWGDSVIWVCQGWLQIQFIVELSPVLSAYYGKALD